MSWESNDFNHRTIPNDTVGNNLNINGRALGIFLNVPHLKHVSFCTTQESFHHIVHIQSDTESMRLLERIKVTFQKPF